MNWESEEICDTSPAGLCEVSGFKYAVSWKAPRAKGVEVRVYAVTTCFGWDSDGVILDGWCLREHTALQKSELVLLAKAPASKGGVTWRLNEYGHVNGSGPDEGSFYSGPQFYAVVLAAYAADGPHSVFAIADADQVCATSESIECPDDTKWPGNG